MILKAIGIIVSQDNNLMWIIHDDVNAIAFDGTDVETLENFLTLNVPQNDKILIIHAKELSNFKTKRKEPLKLKNIFTTHHHFDHSGGNPKLRQKGYNIYDGKNLQEKELEINNFKIKCLHTPCHTRDSFCFLVNNQFLITGDTIFFLGCGKFFEGTGSEMQKNFEKIKNLDSNILCCYGHDYSKTDYRFAKQYFPDLPVEFEKKKILSLGEEKKWNPFMNAENLNTNIDELRKKKNNFK